MGDISDLMVKYPKQTTDVDVTLCVECHGDGFFECFGDAELDCAHVNVSHLHTCDCVNIPTDVVD